MKYIALDDTNDCGGFSGITSFDWIGLALDLLADIASYGSGACGNRDRIPGYRA